MVGLGTSPLAMASLSLGFLFGLTNIAIARNPEMEQGLFTNALIAFALIETFIFLTLLLIGAVFVLF